MTKKKPRRPLAAKDPVLRDVNRLRQRVTRLKSLPKHKTEARQALVLLEDATAIRKTLAARARAIREQIHALRSGLAAASAYRNTMSFVSARAPGERK